MSIADKASALRLRAGLVVLALVAMGGCDDEPEHRDDPDLRIPGVSVPETPSATPEAPAANSEFSPPLAVVGQVEIPEPPMPTFVPGAMQPTGAPITLAAGFQPDPIAVQGLAGGPSNASQMQAGCLGFIAAEPNHRVLLRGRIPTLRFVVSSQADTTLVVRGPDGSMACNDDAEGFNPALDAGLWEEGEYAVWVGVYQPGAPAPYVLGVTQLPQASVNSGTLAQLAHGAP